MPGVIRIGHKLVDNHCLESTLEGDVGDLMNQFRRNCLREYFQAVRLCQEKGIVLTPELLDRGLLMGCLLVCLFVCLWLCLVVG